ncbi:MAG TPA: hypothetical protein VF460_09375 [Burkholderiales bacterium]
MPLVFPARLFWYLAAAATAGILSGLLVFVPYLGALTGVLLALPASAALLVVLRRLRTNCLNSDLYKA